MKAHALDSAPSHKTFEPGDLRAVEGLVEAFLEGRADAEGALLMYGRDAAGIVSRLAGDKKDDRLRALARRLVATPPQLKTNLLALRSLAVAELIAKAHSSAPNATDLGELALPGAQVAIFDPLRIAESIVKGGRVRRDPKRLGAGDLVWFGLGGASPFARVSLSTAAPPADQPVSQNRLRVESGVIFVGPPEAADGPRLGEVRLDAFRTALHAGLEHGRLARLKPGLYVAAAHRGMDGELRVHLTRDPEPDRPPFPADLAALDAPPFTRGEAGIPMDERNPRE